jgi:methylmalonyl-CoA mutase cobalamin-binding subunit
VNTIPQAGRASKTQYAEIVNSFIASGVDTAGVSLSESEKSNTVKRGIVSAIKAAKTDAVCVVRGGSVFLMTGDKAKELGFVTASAPKPRKKKGEKAPAPMVDGIQG